MLNDLVAGIRIPISVPVSAEMRDCAHGAAEPLRRLQAVLQRAVAQEGKLGTVEHKLRFAVRNLASEQCHGKDAPGEDGNRRCSLSAVRN